MHRAICCCVPNPVCWTTGHALPSLSAFVAVHTQVSVGGKDRAVFQWRVVRQAVQQQQPLATPWAQLDNAGLMWGAPPPPQQQQQQHQVSPQQQYAQPYQQQQGMPVGQSPNRGPQGQVIGIGARAAAGAGAGRRAVSASPARGVGMGPAASPGQFAGQQRRR